MDTRAMSKAKIEYSKVDSSGPDQNGKHLLGPIPGGDYDKLFDLEEEALRMDGLTEEEKKSIPSSLIQFQGGPQEHHRRERIHDPAARNWDRSDDES